MKKTRREFVKDAGLVGGAFALYGCSTPGGPTTTPPPDPEPPGPDPDPPTEPPVEPPPQPPFTGIRVRRSVNSLAPNGPELTAYRAAVTAMRALPASDSRSWAAQANIHASACPHNNWFFLPWHRAYLHRFEQICAEMSGVADFALPYWDWSASPTIPASFWGAGNVLNHPRAIGPGETFDAGSVGQAVVDEILATTDTEVFMSGPSTSQQGAGATGQFEGSPHNHVHGRTGRDMGRTSTAALDPIFWLHHANVDRIWAAWNGAVFTDPAWLNFQFTNNFFDASGAAVSHTVRDTLSTVGLGFRYQQPASAARMVASTFAGTGDDGFGLEAELVSAPLPAVVPGSVTTRELMRGEERIESLRTASTRIVPNAELRNLLAGRNAAAAAPAEFRLEALGADGPAARAPAPVQAAGTPRLTIEGVEEPAQPSTVRVFLNAPGATADTPVTDPHYVGSISFFGSDHVDHGGEGGHAGLAHHFDLGPCLDRLGNAGLYSPATDALDVQLVIVPVDGRREGYETSMKAPNKIAISYVQ